MKPATLRPVRAQALTELALMIPLLALLLIALVEVGLLLRAHVQVSSAAREAARAASLYSATRYSSFGSGNTQSCATGIEGWSLQQTIDQAIVRRALDNKNCPSATGAIEYSALGRLSPDKAASTTTAPPCPTGSATGWVAGVNPAFTQSGETKPEPGAQATLTLCYPYRLVIAADLFNYYGDPIWIRKSVVFTYQQ